MPKINRPEVVAEVEAAFARYEGALMDNDTDVLNELFWDDPRVHRYGLGENSYGHDEIAEVRARRKAGQRSLERTLITTFDTEFATADTEFTRLETGRRGRQSQTWVRMPKGWRIVAAHVSWFDPAS